MFLLIGVERKRHSSYSIRFYNRNPEYGWQRMKTTLFLPVLETRKCKIKVLPDSMSSEGLFLMGDHAVTS